MAKQQGNQVPFPIFLDEFGVQIKEAIKHLQSDSLKPALISDIIKVLDRCFVLQQMDVMAYTTAAQNFNGLAATVEAQKKVIETLETKLAGYSQQLNELRGKVAILDGIDAAYLKMAVEQVKLKHDKRMDT